MYICLVVKHSQKEKTICKIHFNQHLQKHIKSTFNIILLFLFFCKKDEFFIHGTMPYIQNVQVR